jgi:hypothetical protein
MKTIIDAIDPKLIAEELNEDRFVRNTNKGNNEIYIIDAHNSPHTMREIGRLREIAFRQAGGGTGKEADIDAYDTADVPFKQLVVWDPQDMELVGGYRFLTGKDIPLKDDGKPNTPTSHLFHISDRFNEEFLPTAIELGRSFVQPSYQSTGNARKGIFALDNLWDGLGVLIVDNPDMEYYFGKITMYTDFNAEAKDLIRYFLETHMGDPDKLIRPYDLLPIESDREQMAALFTADNLDDNFNILQKEVRNLGVNIPPLVSAYMKLSPSMKSFGTALNHNFGGVEETGILIRIADIYDAKKERHIQDINREYRAK